MADHAGRNHDAAGFAELCRLLVGVERQQLLAALQRLQDRAEFTDHLSRSLADAMRAALARDADFAETLGNVIARGVHTTVQRDSAAFGAALAPAMGPAIRKSVWLMLRGLIESLERTVEQRLSLRSLKWRWQAWRSGRSFTEVVFLHTLVFRVEHVFLVHRPSGVQLLHVAPHDVTTRSPEQIAAMLTAIQDFVADAFAAPAGDTLSSFEVGELRVLVETDGNAALAAVVRGQAGQALRLRLRQTLERIELAMGPALAGFRGEVDPFEAVRPELEECLQQQAREGRSGGRRGGWLLRAALAAGALALLVWGGRAWYRAAERSGRFDRFLAELREEPGVAVTGVTADGDGWLVAGLRDPLARDPAERLAGHGLDGDVRLRLQGHLSLHEPFVRQRLLQALAPPQGVVVTLRDGALTVAGPADHAWVTRCRDLLALHGHVAHVDLAGLVDLDATGYAAAAAALREQHSLLLPGADQPLTDALERVLAAGRALQRHGGALGHAVVLRAVAQCADARDVPAVRAAAEVMLQAVGRELAGVAVALAEVRVDPATRSPHLRWQVWPGS